MGIQVTILGSNSAIPTANRRPTAQIVSVDQNYFLVDCGEGTQIQLRKYGIKFQRISHIFISHMHGDHYFGLIGLINTMHLLAREKELHIHGPKEIKEVIDLQLKVANSHLRYPLIFHELQEGQTGPIFENDKLEIHTAPCDHRIPCFGFLFKEKEGDRKISKEAIAEFNLSIEEILNAKAGKDVLRENGEHIANQVITTAPPKPLSYAFITDTKPVESYYKLIHGVDLLYHEATFSEEFRSRAKETHHSTAKQAAEVALKNECKKLIIGHFSTRYKSLDPLLKEAKEVFANTELAEEGNVFQVN